VEGLEPHVQYHLLLHVRPVDQCRYHFFNHRWVAAQEEEETSQDDLKTKEWQLYTHPDSPGTGSSWMTSSVNFSAIKIAQYCGSSRTGNVR